MDDFECAECGSGPCQGYPDDWADLHDSSDGLLCQSCAWSDEEHDGDDDDEYREYDAD